MKAKLMIARFPYGGSERAETCTWLNQLHRRVAADQRIGETVEWLINDTPITMGRNRCLKVAAELGCDFVLMVDSDMAPDLNLGADPHAVPFYDAAMAHALAHPGPCVVAAPYCGPPPHENVYVFRWLNLRSSGQPDPNAQLGQYTREEAAALGGVQECAALPTGLCLIDMRAVARVKAAKRKVNEQRAKAQLPPLPEAMFYYEWTDVEETDKASTEDVTFSRDLSMAGVPMYCAWDSWAGHCKSLVVQKPKPWSPDIVRDIMREAVLSAAPRDGERRIVFKQKVG